jgi:hypothetical protein
MPPNPYQRIIVSGIPVWKDAEGRLYYYQTATPPTPDTRIQIGTEATGLNPDLKSLLEPHLRSYRESSVSRARGVKN